MRLVVLLLATIATVACGGESLREAEDALHVSDEPIVFPRTFVGYSSERQVVVTSASRAPKEFQVSTEPPFAVTTTGKVEGSKGGVVTVTFAPELAGRFEGILRFELGDATVRVPVSGPAENPPPCAPSTTCRIVHFDEVTGECTERVAPDGTSCEGADQCLVDQVCKGGVCLGAPRVCEEGDLCTEYKCDSKRGCLAIDKSGECEVPDDPCKAAYCDPITGCGVTDTPDGTPCGPGDCVTASICWVGSCTVVDVPDGTPCTTACGTGACKNKACDRPAGDVLERSWSRTMARGVELIFPGIGDASGNLYWAECGASCELVSVEPKGHVRFRRDVPGGRVTHPEQLLLEEASAWVVAGSTLSASSNFDGAIELTRDLREELDQEAGGACPCTWAPGSLASDGAGGLWLWMMGSARDFLLSGGDEPPPVGVLASIDAGTGAIRHARAIPDVERASALVTDRDGNVYATVYPRTGDPVRLSVTPDGIERWSIETPLGVSPVATVGELVFEGLPRAVRAESGLLSYDLPAFPAESSPAVVASTKDGFAVGASADGARVIGFLPADGTVVQDVRISHVGELLDWTRPVLTSRGGALFAVTYSEEEEPTGDANRPEAIVREAAADGSEARACLLPGPSIYGGRTFLRSGAWTVVSREGDGGYDTVHQFQLPKADIAGSGWVNLRGSLSGNGRPH
ncbi:MAG TPA: hypothetical protein VN033_01870 [Vulgatibacter sp.]|nr:hypothetical protein [Vulgatibacter sp.]